jgi:Pel9A-like, right handed beta helix region/Secretion system C-terminal sorting domain
MVKLKVYTCFIFLVLNTNIFSQIYVAPDGNDSNAGTIDQPLESIQKAQELVSPGDTVYIRGGTYQVREDQISKVVSGLFACYAYLDKSGTESKTIKYWAYPGETPVFDFSAVKPANQRVVGIYVIGSYIHLKGLDMTGIQTTITSHTESYCIYSRGNNNIYEQIRMHDNVGTGLRHYNGGGNLFLNCDSYKNWDNVSENKLGGNNDGFGCHPNTSGTGNVFKGCRAWFNSDDGFDIIRSGAAVEFDSCWAFDNGYSTSFQSLGDGNGFKAGGFAYDPENKIPTPVPQHTIKFCIAVRNKANGFDSNHHLNGNFWYNNSAYQNDINFNMVNRLSPQADSSIWENGYNHVLKNNLSYKARGSDTAYIDTSQNTLSHNSFDLGINIIDKDFVGLDESQLTAPRKPDGSLPDIDFMRPAQGSDLIDAGIDIGYDYSGNAPELGAIEVNYTTGIKDNEGRMPEKILLLQNYPNPFNPSTNIIYKAPNSGNIKITIYDLMGRKIKTLINEMKSRGTYEVRFDGSNLASGIYFYKLQMNGNSVVKQMLLLK